MSSAAERCPSWSPWESHPVDDRRNVSSILTDGGPAACVGGLGVALVRAVLDANIRSIPDTQGDSFPSTTEVGPALRQQPGPRTRPVEEVMP